MRIMATSQSGQLLANARGKTKKGVSTSRSTPLSNALMPLAVG